MTENNIVAISLETVVLGSSGKPQKNLIGEAILTQEILDAADDLTIGDVLLWILLEGIQAPNIKEMNKIIIWADRIKKAIPERELPVNEGEISQLEEILAKCENKAMTNGIYLGALVREFKRIKEEIITKKNTTK